jgi:hypothetical protein
VSLPEQSNPRTQHISSHLIPPSNNPDKPAGHYINVRDIARLHVAATTDGPTTSQRTLAFAAPFNWNDILAILRRLRPHSTIPADLPDLGRDVSTVDNALGRSLLRKWWRQDGFVGLEESVGENLEGVV